MVTPCEMEMELEVWPGDWGIPSIDHHSLAVLAYCKFSGVPVTLKKCTNPWKSPSGELPVLKHEGGLETKVSDIFNYLRKKNWGLDHDLSTKQCADIVAFTAMLEEKLFPALLHLWWVDSKTFVEFTRPWYAKTLPFPLNMYFPLKKNKEYTNYLNEVLGVDHLTDSEREQKLYKDAKECLNLLSAKLGDSNYFFGSSPSSLDAVVFGYLVPLLKAPFPSTALQNHLKACPNLCQLCQGMLNKYFPLTPQEQEELRKKEEEIKQKQAASVEFPNKRRNMMVAGTVAITAMLGYAFLSGLVQIEVVDDKNKPGESSAVTPNFNQFDDLLDDEGDEPRGEQKGHSSREEDRQNANE